MGLWLAIFVGGGIGACLRVALMLWIDPRTSSTFPWGLLAVNSLGCFGIGMLATFADDHGWLGPTARAFAVPGLLGGFTTLASFGLDTLRLASTGHLGMAGANVAASLLFAVAGVATGAMLARSMT